MLPRSIVLIVVLLHLTTGCASVATPEAPTPSPTPLVLEPLFPRDGIVALDHPPARPAAEAADHITPQSLVIGVVIDGEARAYPVNLLGRYEVANDTLGGTPILVTFCPLCNSGIVASRRVETDEGELDLTFGVSGQVLDQAVVLIDQETESLWPQSRAAASSGPLAGTLLDLLPSQQLSWDEWQAAHPTSTLMVPSDASRTAPSFEPPGMGSTPQLPTLEPTWSGYIVGVEIEGEAVAFPLEAVAAEAVIQAQLAGQTILAVAGTQAGEVRLWRLDPAGAPGPLTLVEGDLHDESSGSSWDALTGEVTSGPAVQPLVPVEGQLMHLAAWWAWHPNSQLER